jgi:hypothetical protein
MAIGEFISIEKESLNRFLTANGIYLCSRQEPKLYIDLYHVRNFYVEVFYHHKKDQMVCVKAFEDVKGLRPYLNGIDFSKLFESTFLRIN